MVSATVGLVLVGGGRTLTIVLEPLISNWVLVSVMPMLFMTREK